MSIWKYIACQVESSVTSSEMFVIKDGILLPASRCLFSKRDSNIAQNLRSVCSSLLSWVRRNLLTSLVPQSLGTATLLNVQASIISLNQILRLLISAKDRHDQTAHHPQKLANSFPLLSGLSLSLFLSFRFQIEELLDIFLRYFCDVIIVSEDLL